MGRNLEIKNARVVNGIWENYELSLIVATCLHLGVDKFDRAIDWKSLVKINSFGQEVLKCTGYYITCWADKTG